MHMVCVNVFAVKTVVVVAVVVVLVVAAAVAVAVCFFILSIGSPGKCERPSHEAEGPPTKDQAFPDSRGPRVLKERDKDGDCKANIKKNRLCVPFWYVTQFCWQSFRVLSFQVNLCFGIVAQGFEHHPIWVGIAWTWPKAFPNYFEIGNVQHSTAWSLRVTISPSWR